MGLEPGRVLIIEDDPWTASVLARFLRERGHEVFLCGDARSGFAKACEWLPDCIVCNVVLPDIDGLWVARRIRTEPSSVATTPFLFLTNDAERDSRVQGLHVGADAYLTRPFTNDEAVAQVEALIDMARRLRARRDSFRSEAPSSRGAAFRGDLEHMSLATVLMVLGMERRAGTLRVVSDAGRKAELVIVADTFSSGSLDGKENEPLEVLRDVLQWKHGRFSFLPLADARSPNMRASVSALLLEAMQLEDETRAGRK